MQPKKKLLIVAGAGASIEFGIPSVNEVDRLFDIWSNDYLSIPSLKCSLYSYLKKQIEAYYIGGTARKQTTNFEEVLFTALNLYSLRSDYKNNPTAAFIHSIDFPEILYFGKTLRPPTNHDFEFLASYLIDNLLKHIRSKSIEAKTSKSNELSTLNLFLNKLRQKFDLGVLTFNYDNIIASQLPNANTGFDPTGSFKPELILNDSDWNFMYQIHGSVHFDMPTGPGDMHEIFFKKDLTDTFSQNSSGRSTITSVEEQIILHSNIIAGYGKTNQIQRNPFYLYMIDVCKKFYEADAFLFLGYGFSDYYINNAIELSLNYKRKRPVVVVTYSDDTEDPMRFRNDPWSHNLLKTIRTDTRSIASSKHSATPFISKLKADKDLEVSRDNDRPLAIWHSGFLDACNNSDKILKELTI